MSSNKENTNSPATSEAMSSSQLSASNNVQFSLAAEITPPAVRKTDITRLLQGYNVAQIIAILSNITGPVKPTEKPTIEGLADSIHEGDAVAATNCLTQLTSNTMRKLVDDERISKYFRRDGTLRPVLVPSKSILKPTELPVTKHRKPCVGCGESVMVSNPNAKRAVCTKCFEDMPISAKAEEVKEQEEKKQEGSTDGAKPPKPIKRSAVLAAKIAADGKTKRAKAAANSASKLSRGTEGKSASEVIASDVTSTASMDLPWRMRPSKEEPAPAVDPLKLAEPRACDIVCPDVLKSGFCFAGALCPYVHPDPDHKPYALPSLDAAIADHRGMFNVRKDPYHDNPTNAHQRTLEPTELAWAEYRVPTCHIMGMEEVYFKPGSEGFSQLRKPIGTFVNTGSIRRVRLLKHVVETMRGHFLGAPRDTNLAHFLQAMTRVERVCANIRMTAAEVNLHKKYATLIGFYCDEFNSDLALVKGEAWIVRWLHDANVPIKDTALALGGMVGITAAALYVSGLQKQAETAKRALFMQSQEIEIRKSILREQMRSSFIPPAGSLFSPREVNISDNPVDVALVSYKFCVGPIVEEAIKHIVNEKGERQWMLSLTNLTAIALWETFNCVREIAIQPEHAVPLMCGQAATTGMHLVTFAMPLNVAIMVHSAWNIMTTCFRTLQIGMIRENEDHLTRIAMQQATDWSPRPGCAGPVFGALSLFGLTLGSWWARRKERVDNEESRERWRLALWGGMRTTDKFLHKYKGRKPRLLSVYPAERMVPSKKVPEVKPGTSVIQMDDRTVEEPLKDDRAIHSNVSEQDSFFNTYNGHTDSIKGLGQPKDRYSVAKYGIGMPEYRPLVPANTSENVKAVIDHRMVKNTIKAESATMRDFIKWRRVNERDLYTYPNETWMGFIRSTPRQIFLSRIGSSPAVKKLLIAAGEELDRMGVNEHTRLSKSFLRMIAGKHKMFVKREGLSLRGPDGIADKAGRPILPCHPMLIMLVGPWFMSYYGALNKCWGMENFATLAGGSVTNEMIGNSLSECFDSGMKLLEDDCGSWDVTMDDQVEPISQADIFHYQEHGAPIAFVQIMMTESSITILCAFGWKVKKPKGQMVSGRPDTWGHNGERNVEGHTYIVCRVRKITVKQLRETKQVKMFVSGDDNALAHTGPAIPFHEGMRALGHEADALYRSELSHVGFCSATLRSCSEGTRLTPNVANFISRHGYIIDPPRDVERESLMRGVALSQQANFAHHPIANALVDRLLELTEGHKAVMPKHEQHKIKSASSATATVATWEELYDDFSWTQDTQLRWWKLLQTKQLGDDITLAEMPELRNIMERTLPCVHRDGDHPFTAGNYHSEVSFKDFDYIDPEFANGLMPLIKGDNSGWVRDLTAEGVEPNPGWTGGLVIAIGGVVASGVLVSKLVADALLKAMPTIADPVTFLVKYSGHTIPMEFTPDTAGHVKVGQLYKQLTACFGLDFHDRNSLITCNGKQLFSKDKIYGPEYTVVHVSYRLLGGNKSHKSKNKLVKEALAKGAEVGERSKSHKAKSHKKTTKKEEKRPSRPKRDSSNPNVNKNAAELGVGKKVKAGVMVPKGVRGIAEVSVSFLAHMRNPFTHPAVKIGWGRQPSELIRLTADFILNSVSNTDFTQTTGAFCQPLNTSGGSVYYGAGARASNLTPWNTGIVGSNWAQAGALNTAFTSCRTLALGLEWCVLRNNDTSKPLLSVGTAMAPTSTANFLATTNNQNNYGSNGYPSSSTDEIMSGRVVSIPNDSNALDMQLNLPTSGSGVYNSSWPWPLISSQASTSGVSGAHSLYLKFSWTIEAVVAMDKNASSLEDQDVSEMKSVYDASEVFNMMASASAWRDTNITIGIKSIGAYLGASVGKGNSASPMNVAQKSHEERMTTDDEYADSFKPRPYTIEDPPTTMSVAEASRIAAVEADANTKKLQQFMEWSKTVDLDLLKLSAGTGVPIDPPSDMGGGEDGEVLGDEEIAEAVKQYLARKATTAGSSC